ncbi:hypothetical protein [Afipia sp. DC4300-2b1]|uniref:hypothetical protein n=1 Tax=Afipia sp. DC4300-2b1 TaxID=2804672 RepID=UPI003CF0BAD6
MATVVLAEKLGRPTFSGAAITPLVHTDIAWVHAYNGGLQVFERPLHAGCQYREEDNRGRRHRT